MLINRRKRILFQGFVVVVNKPPHVAPNRILYARNGSHFVLMLVKAVGLGHCCSKLWVFLKKDAAMGGVPGSVHKGHGKGKVAH